MDRDATEGVQTSRCGDASQHALYGRASNNGPEVSGCRASHTNAALGHTRRVHHQTRLLALQPTILHHTLHHEFLTNGDLRGVQRRHVQKQMLLLDLLKHQY
jgi:hypothetical protein